MRRVSSILWEETVLMRRVSSILWEIRDNEAHSGVYSPMVER